MTDDIRRLLGGYATGTLTESERRALFEASLRDQELFEALADEELLRQVLEDPAARATLLQAAENRRFTIAGGLREWFERPKAKFLVATACVLLAAIGYRALTERPAAQVAQLRIPAETRQVPEPVPAAPQESPAAPQPSAVRRVPAKSQPARSVVSEVQPAAPKEAPQETQVATAPPPPAAPGASPELVTRVVEMRPVAIRYTLLRRTESGDYVPVPEDYLFSPADQVRLRVEVNGNGFLAVTDENREPLYAVQVTPGSPVVIPRTLSVADRDRTIDIAFTPGWNLSEPQAQTMRSEFRSQADEQPPSPRGARATAAAPAQVERVSSPRPSRITLRVVLRHKP